MDKRRNTFIIMLVLASALSVAAIAEFMHVSKIELAKTEKVRGRVTAAAVTQRVIRGIKYNRTETIFWFRLHNVAENFAIHQPHDAYSDLERNVREGDWLIVYFKGSSAFYNTHVYQVEKKGKIIFSFFTYKERASNKAGYMIIGGAIVFAIAIIGYTNFNIFQFLLKLADTSPKER